MAALDDGELNFKKNKVSAERSLFIGYVSIEAIKIPSLNANQGWELPYDIYRERRKSIMSCCCAAVRALNPLTDPHASPTGVLPLALWLAGGQ